jgi:hypothetical protein
MAMNEHPACEVCGAPIEHGEAVVLGQEGEGVTILGLNNPGAEGRVALFHEEHWPMRVGDWVERDRGHER